MTEASCRHCWCLYRKTSQQVGNTHCTSLVSGTRMKYTFSHCGVLSVSCLLLFQWGSTLTKPLLQKFCFLPSSLPAPIVIHPCALLLLLTVQPSLAVQPSLPSVLNIALLFLWVLDSGAKMMSIRDFLLKWTSSSSSLLPTLIIPMHATQLLPSFFPLPSTLAGQDFSGCEFLWDWQFLKLFKNYLRLGLLSTIGLLFLSLFPFLTEPQGRRFPICTAHSYSAMEHLFKW